MTPTVNEVEARASADSTSVDAIVGESLKFDLFDQSFRTFCAQNAAELLPRLKSKVSDRPVSELFAITRILLQNEDASACTILLDLLETGDTATQQQAVIEIGMRHIGREVPVPIDEPRALRLLRPRLQAPDAHWRKSAADTLFRLSSPEVRDIKLQMLSDPEMAMRLAAAAHLAREGDPAGWPVLRDILLDPSDKLQHERYWAIANLKILAASGADAPREDIAHLAARQITERFDRSDNATANDVWNLLAVIEAAAPSWEATFLQTVISSRLMAWPRGVALKRRAKLESLASLPRLRATLDDSQLASDALSALSELGSQAATPDIVDRIRRLLAETRDTKVVTNAAQALAALGHGSDPVLVTHTAKLQPWQRFCVSIRAKAISADAFLSMLQDSGVLDGARLAAAGPDALERFRVEWREGKEDIALCALLTRTKALHWFDAENDRVPPNYVELLSDLAEMVRPRLGLESITMRAGQDGGAHNNRHEVWLLLDGRPVRILVKDIADWFDIGGLLGQLNTEIASSGKPDRFAVLYTGDPTAQIVLGHGDRLLALHLDYNFPIIDDPDAPIRVGQNFERQVIADLDGKKS